MVAFIEKLLAQRSERDSVELVWELEEALSEKQARNELLTPAEETALRLCRVDTCDGIAEVIRNDPESLKLAADFAEARGLPRTAAILADAHRGNPVPGPVSFSTVLDGVRKDLDVPQDQWGATDISLSLLDEDLGGAILDYVSENVGTIGPDAPAMVASTDAATARIADLASGRTFIELMTGLLAHRSPRIRAQIVEDQRSGTSRDWIDVPVVHRASGPAKARILEELAGRYGPIAAPLLELYANHDGLELFATDAQPGFCFLPIAHWPGELEHVMEWTRMTWEDEPDEMPDYIESAIPFGYIPGDSERWILVTRGKHAGAVMLSNSDAIEDKPRIASLPILAATLILQPDRVLGSGGYVSYGPEENYYPEGYLHA